ncbi:MAG: response regulator [Terracidiphilus sp.]|nr:response regulator [Terracidiphilus sp.]
MTTEPTQPQVEMGPAPANGQGQSQGHRRRRRRRKNKSSQPGAPQAPQGQQQQQPAQAAPQPQSQGQQQPPRQNPPSQGRKKKKFFKSNGGGHGQPQPEPGNRIAPPQGRRKDKQRGPRTFVGPMDHSYRVANGNVADSPPSTIPVHSNGNGNGNYYPDHYQSAPAPVREDAPTRIFCYIEDLFFQAKIQETARKLGVKVEFVKIDSDLIGRFADAPEAERPSLVVFDLNNLNAKPLSLIPKFKSKFKKSTSVVGFLNHLQGDLKMKALEVGCDSVMPRSAFSQTLPNLLRRYGLEEEEEYYPQPV